MVPDQDGDGKPDLLAGIPLDDTALGLDAGSAILFSAADCSILRRFEDPAGSANTQFGNTVAALGDLSGDGIAEVGVGPARDPEVLNFKGVRLFAHEGVCDADGMSPFQGDCDDTDSTTYRQAPEVCDGRDNDCDAVPDDDGDGDGHAACQDCDVINPSIHPGAAEICNGRDDDCDLAVDQGADADGDGVTTPCDCDDGDPSIHPGATEACDHLDRNCDGRMDEGAAPDASLVPGPDPSAGQRLWTVDLASPGDVDGDTVPDFAAGIPAQPLQAISSAGEVVLYSGRDRSEICRARDPTPGTSEAFGSALAALPDVSGDGIADLAVGVPGDSSFIGSVVILSGADCTFVRRCLDPQLTFSAQLGKDLAAVGDLTGDGISEVAATAAGALSNTGQVTVFNPLDCAPVLRLVDPNGPQDAGQQSVTAAGDVTSDGVPDIAVGEYLDAVGGIKAGSVLIYSGASGSLIRRLRHPNPQSSAEFGRSVSAVEDLTDDGIQDLVVGAPGDAVGGATQQGSVLLYSGRDGSFLRLCTVPQIFRLGIAVAGAGDLTGDGLPDVVAGADDDFSDFPIYRSFSGKIVIFSGADCSVVQDYLDPAGRSSDRLGLALLAPGDLGGDAGTEIVTSSARGLFIISREADCDGDGVTPFRGDCDDADPVRAAGRLEICDGKDNDCDLAVDEDGDGDGIAVCADCDDAHAAAHSGGTEICDALDNDCDGSTDEGFDPDGDGLPSCADNCPSIANPGQADAEGDGIGDACDVETCDGFDNDGDGSVDEGFGGIPDTCNHLDDDCDGGLDPASARAWNRRVISRPGGAAGDRFGQSIAGIGDVDGDHVPDLVAGADFATVSGNTRRGRASIVSGGSQSVLCDLTDPAGEASDRLGATVAGIGDVDGDGVPDVAAGSPEDYSGNQSRGSVSLFSGADCSFLRKCANPAGNAGSLSGQSLAGIVDITGDGVPDLAVGDPGSTSVAGKVVIFSGADCAVVRQLADPLAPLGARLGTSVVATGDLSGDGVGDLLAGSAGGNGGAVLFSLADGSVLRRLSDPGAPAGSGLGSSVALLPDVSADGVPDLAVGAMTDDSPFTDMGSVSIFSGADGTRLRKCSDPQGSPLARLGTSVAAYPDFDGDGVPDLVALAQQQHTQGGPRNGAALILSGASCAVLARLSFDAGSNPGPPLVGSSVDRMLAVPGDLDGDHAAEVVGGAPWANGGFSGKGLVLVFGRTSDCDGDGATPLGGDCDDASTARTPGQVEQCDGVDNDCDVEVDEDSDGDGFAACADCDNGRAAAWPGAVEACNGLDDNCNQVVDDGPDADGDGVSAVCDCADRNAGIRPGAAEACNHLDDDCDGRVDEASPQDRSATLLTDPAGSATGQLGQWVTGIGDVDSDGVTDFAATNGASEVLVFSGRSGAVRCRGFGRSPLAGIQDVTGDGVPDIVVRSLNNNAVGLLSGATCGVVSTCGASGASGIGSSVAALGDVNADGIPDYATGAPGQTATAPAGEVQVFSGANCTFLYRVTDTTLSAGANFGFAVAGPGDVTGDGWPDLVVGAPNDSSLGVSQAGRIVVVSGPDGVPVRRLHDPAAAPGDRLGSRLDVAGDLDGDGVKDLFAYAATDAPPNADVGSVLLFSGVGNAILRRCSDPQAAANLAFGSSLAAAGDLTGDGVPDFVTGERTSLPGASLAGSVAVVSSADCSIVARLTDPAPIASGNLAIQGLAVPGDLTGDGRSDIVAGSDSTTFPVRGHLVLFSETSSCENPDNCPAVANPFQRDSDSDVPGNLCDVCPANPDPLQTDTDLDGAGDACDCRPTDATSRGPGEQVRLDLNTQGRIFWTASPSAEGYFIRRGDLAARAYGYYGVCWQHVTGSRAGDTGVLDSTLPAVGSGLFYFVQGEDNLCGKGSLGFDSLERPRTVSGPDVCP
jgi:hypothetical protein